MYLPRLAMLGTILWAVQRILMLTVEAMGR